MFEGQTNVMLLAGSVLLSGTARQQQPWLLRRICQRILSSVCPCRHSLRSQHYAGSSHNNLVPIRSRTRREGRLRIIHHPTFLFIMCEKSSLLRSFYVSPGVRRNRVRVEIYTGLREHLRCNPWLRPVCNF